MSSHCLEPAICIFVERWSEASPNRLVMSCMVQAGRGEESDVPIGQLHGNWEAHQLSESLWWSFSRLSSGTGVATVDRGGGSLQLIGGGSLQLRGVLVFFCWVQSYIFFSTWLNYAPKALFNILGPGELILYRVCRLLFQPNTNSFWLTLLFSPRSWGFQAGRWRQPQTPYSPPQPPPAGGSDPWTLSEGCPWSSWCLWTTEEGGTGSSDTRAGTVSPPFWIGKYEVHTSSGF